MFLGLLALFIGQLIGNSIVPIGTKISSPLMGPVLFVFLRFAVSTLLLFLIFIFSQKKKLKFYDYLDFALIGFILTVDIVLFTYGIAYTTIIMNSLIFSLTPILVGIVGHFYLDEPLDRQKILGLIIAFAGLLFLLSQSLLHNQQNVLGNPLGNILIFLAMLCYSIYIIQSRKVLHKKNHQPLQTTFFTFFFVTLFMLLLIFLGLITGNIDIKPVPTPAATGILIVASGSSLMYFLVQFGIKKTTAFTASIFQYLGPFIAASISIPFLHEKITLNLIIGGTLILTGLFIATTYGELKKKFNFKHT